MKNNKGAKLLLLISVIAILLLVYFLVIPKLNKPAEVAEEPDESVVIADYKSDDLTAFSYTCAEKDVSFSFSYKSSTYSWYLADDTNFPVDQEQLGEMSGALLKITADRSLGTDSISREDAGLTSPAYTITAKYGKTEKTYYIGNYNGFTQSYYFAVEGDDNIYLISNGLESYFGYTLLQFAAYEDIPVMSTENVSSYEVRTTLETYTYTDTAHITYLNSLYISGCVEYNPDADALAAYMLDSNASTITVNYTETLAVQNEDASITDGAGIEVQHQFTVKVGALCDGDDSKRYVMLNDSPLVYKMSASTLESIMTHTEESAVTTAEEA